MSLPFNPLNVGDIHDDDAEIIDDLIEQQAEPPKPLPDIMVTPTEKRPTPVTRLQTGRQDLFTGWEPVMVLPKDEFRRTVTISTNSAAGTDAVYIGSDPQTARNGGAVFQANPISLHEYTGAVWVYNPGANPVTISWWAVTK